MPCPHLGFIDGLSGSDKSTTAVEIGRRASWRYPLLTLTARPQSYQERTNISLPTIAYASRQYGGGLLPRRRLLHCANSGCQQLQKSLVIRSPHPPGR